MKISVEDLKKSIDWVRAHSNQDMIEVSIEPNKFIIDTFDRADKQVTMTLYADNGMMATIKKTEWLK